MGDFISKLKGMKDRFTIGVFGLITNDEGKVLLCHRTDMDLWNLPGGALEFGEAPWEGVIREVREETGLDVEVESFTGIYCKPKDDDLVLSFKCKVIGRELTLNDEADRLEYFSMDQIPANTNPKQVQRIQDYFDDPGKTNFKTQIGISSKELLKKLNLL